MCVGVEGWQGGVPRGRGGVVKVSRLVVELGSWPQQHKHNVRTCMHNNSKKKCGTPIMLISLQTKSRALNTMVPSKMAWGAHMTRYYYF
jgi:hypothetical protein